MNTDLNMEVIRDYAKLSQEKRDLLAEVDAVIVRMNELKPIVITELTLNGVDRMPVDVGKGRCIDVSLVRIVRAHLNDGCDRSDACDAIENAGLGEELLRVDYNLTTMSSYVRDQLAAGAKLPIELERAFNISNTPDLRTKVKTKKATPSSHASDTMNIGGAFGADD